MTMKTLHRHFVFVFNHFILIIISVGEIVDLHITQVHNLYISPYCCCVQEDGLHLTLGKILGLRSAHQNNSELGHAILKCFRIFF